MVRGVLPASGCPVIGGRPTGPGLVSVVGQWKYYGVRGLAWPLAPLLQAAVTTAEMRHGPVDCLVPIALHARRRRQRGFNQAAVVAHLIAKGTGRSVRTDILRRGRATGQQAKLASEEERRRNVVGAFSALPAQGRAGTRRIGLVDDLVTGGTTCDEAVRVLEAAGWKVIWVATLGLAATGGSRNGSSGGRFDGQVDTVSSKI